MSSNNYSGIYLRPQSWTNKLLQEYLSLGGRRLSKIDDNITDVR
jgi:hypothetical protein